MSSKQPPKTENLYNAFITGEVLDGFGSAQVQSWLASTLKLTPTKAGILLTGTSKCIKQGLDKSAAAKFRTLFESNGVAVRLQLQKVKDTAKPSATHRTATSPGKTQAMHTQFFQGTLTSHPAKWKETASVTGIFASLVLVMAAYAGVVGLLLAIIVRALVQSVFPSGEASPLEFTFFTLLPALLAVFFFGLILRPFLGRDAITEDTLEASANKQVKLFQYVKEIYEQVGTTPPNSIRFSNELHCNANYVYHFPKLLSGERHLTISLPLIATLNSRQLSVLIAHEAARLQHPENALAQSLSQKIQQRFEAASSNTDTWATNAEAREQSAESFIKHFFAAGTHRLIIFSSLLIKPFSRVLALLSNRASHALVFTADHYSAALAGSRQLSDTFVQMHCATHALHQANEKIFSRIGERKLPDNFPALVQHFYVAIENKQVKSLADEVNRGETRRHHDSPTDRERIIRVEDLELPAIESQLLPASALLENANAVYLKATHMYYQNQELDFSDAELVDVRELTSLAQKDQLRDQLSSDYFNRWFTPQVFWRLPTPSTIKPLNHSERIALLNENIARIRHATPDFMRLINSELTLVEQRVHFSAANEVRKAGYKIVAQDFGLTEQQVELFQQFHEKTKISHQGFKSRFMKLNELMGTRLFLATALHPDANRRKVGLMLLQALAGLTSQNTKLQTLRIRVGYLPLLMARVSERKEENLEPRVLRVTKDINEFCQSVLHTLASHTCGFHQDYDTIAAFIRAHVKQEFNHEDAQPLESIGYYYEICHGLSEANRMVNSQLALIARDSEQANKITPVKLTA